MLNLTQDKSPSSSREKRQRDIKESVDKESKKEEKSKPQAVEEGNIEQRLKRIESKLEELSLAVDLFKTYGF